MKRKPYSSDLSDKQGAILEPLIRPAKHGGRPRSLNVREVLNAIFYILGALMCVAFLLPHDLPPEENRLPLLS